MKNYELMAILEKLPSGFEIVTSGTMTEAQLCHDGAVDQDGKRIYLLVE